MGSDSPHPEDLEQQKAPVNISTLFLVRESGSDTEVDTLPASADDAQTPTNAVNTPLITDDMQVDLASAVGSFK